MNEHMNVSLLELLNCADKKTFREEHGASQGSRKVELTKNAVEKIASFMRLFCSKVTPDLQLAICVA